jgi:glycine/D-amino acid oxidase-like deaminating enzyme
MRPWGEPPWRRIEVPARPLENSTPDVAIIGGGLTGIAAAYHLARRGIRAVVLEAQRLGDGASGRTGGIVLEGTARGIVEGADRCVPTLAQLVKEAGIDCDLRLPGCWEIAHRDDTEGEPLPWKDDGHGVRIVRTVAGGTVDPMALLTQLALAAADAGAILHEHAEVRRLIIEPHPVLELDGAVIRPRFVIVAVNAWTSHLLPSVRQVESSLTFACATEPLSDSTLHDVGLGPAIPFYTVDTPYLWGRQTRDRRMIFGAGLTYGPPEELEQLSLNAAEPAAVLARLETRVHRLHPALRDVRVTHRWGGPIGIPQGGMPLIGSLPQAPSILVAGGYSGHGVALSVWVGHSLAYGIMDGESFPEWGAIVR